MAPIFDLFLLTLREVRENILSMRGAIAILLGGLLLAAPAAVQAQFTYTTNAGGSTITVTGYTGPPGAVTIPPTITGLPVTTIGASAFSGAGLTGVTIPGSVTTIGSFAFYGCAGLTNVTIPGSVISIGDNAFAHCGLTSLTIPGSVTSIEDNAFWYCSHLTSVTIPSSVTSIGDYAFFDCANLAAVYFTGNPPTADSTVFFSDNNVTVYYFPGSTGWASPFAGVPAVLLSSPRHATATASITNGFVVAITISDAGLDYTNTPLVYLVGGGGSGAQAIATVSNGIVTGITVIHAGSGYTNAPVVAITPPFPLMLGVGTAAAYLAFTNLTVGASYQLQLLQSGTWENLGSPFMAGSGTYTQYVDGAANGSSFRLVAVPIPSGATATPILAYDFVVAATVIDGGSGYVSVPGVQITGGGGSGAQATATVVNGVVTAITVTNAGFGYTSLPSVRQKTPDFFPGWRLMNLGLDAFVPATIQNSS